MVLIYVDDFLVSSKLLCRNSEGHFNRERGMRTISHRQALKIETLPDGGFHLRQQKFVDQLELMCRSRADTDKLTPGELTQLRGVSGSANWLGNQTRPDLCEHVSSPRCTCISNGG